MSLRALWLVSVDGMLLFTRRFPTVERRYRTCSGAQYQPLPPDAQIGRLFLTEFRDDVGHNGVVSALDHDSVWPIVFARRATLFLLGVPSIDALDRRIPLIELPQVTATLQLLEELLLLLPRVVRDAADLQDFSALVASAIPLGTPVETSAKTLRLLQRAVFAPEPLSASSEKRVGWRPVAGSSPGAVELLVREEVSCAQYGSDTVPDVVSLVGSLLCKADLPATTELTLALSLAPPPPYFAVHPCVRAQGGVSLSLLRCLPPQGIASLCDYSGVRLPQPPIRGFYQMRRSGADGVRLLLQLKLSDNVPNAFDVCEAIIPFAGRGDIQAIDADPPVGNVGVMPNKRALVWTIGPKFTGKNLEIALQAAVRFRPAAAAASTVSAAAPASAAIAGTAALASAGSAAAGGGGGGGAAAGATSAVATLPAASAASVDEDMYAAGDNSYVKMRFKLRHFTLSGAAVDTRSVSFTPAGGPKPSVAVDREVESGEYLIWNSLGQVRHAAPIPADISALS